MRRFADVRYRGQSFELTVPAEGLDGLGINNAPILNERGIADLRAAKLKLNVWTIDNVATAKRLMRLGVDGIITNRPGWLKSQVEARAKSPAREGRLVITRRRT